MNPITQNVLKLERNNTLTLVGSRKIIFLCGVVFDNENSKDKRTTLKNYLLNDPALHPLILEENFGPRTYNRINLHNLYDVETLVACFANGTIIIHESISTGSELGMLAANKSVASKLLVIHPDRDSVEESKITSFIYFAFYGGDKPVLDKKWAVPFYPALERKFDSNDRYVYHTTFPDNLEGNSYTRNTIGKFLAAPSVQLLKSLKFMKPKYLVPSVEQPSLVDYYLGGPEGDIESLQIHISPMALRELLFGLVSIDEVQDKVHNSTSLSEVMTVLEEELQKLLLATAEQKLAIKVLKIKINLKGLELSTFQDKTTSQLRKAIGLFIFLLKTLSYLSIENDTHFKFKRDFNVAKALYNQMIVQSAASAFEDHMLEEA